MHKKSLWLISFVFALFFFTTNKAQAQLIPCSPACETPTGICAMDPSGVTTNITTNNGSAGYTEETPTVQCQLTGTSWCTGNMLDGWSILTGPTTSQSVTESGKLFRILDGTLVDSSSSNRLNPGDAQSSFSSTASCSVTVTPNDPDSTLPDKTLDSNNNYSSENDLYWMPDYGLEAVVDCSHVNGSNEVVPQVKLYWNNIPYPGFDLGSLVISRKKSTEYYYQYINILTNWSYDGNLSNFIDDSTDWDRLENNNTYDYYVYSYLEDYDGHPYNYDYNYESNVVRVPVNCPDPNPAPPLSNGFNVSGAKSGDSVALQWNDQGSDVVQYYVVKDLGIINDDIPSSYNWWGLVVGSPDNFPVASTESTFVKYVTNQNSFTDPNAVLGSGEVAKYRVYAYKLLPLGLGVGYYDYRFEHWDSEAGSYDYSWYYQYPQEFDQNIYTWNSKYPWDHELVLSEEIVVHADGSIDETDTDPVDGGTLSPCSGTCITSADCDSGLSCISSQCRNSACPTESGCACSMNPALISSLTDVLSNNFTTRSSKHTLWYDIRIDTVVTDGSLLVTFPSDFNFGSLASGDISVTGGDVTWGSATVNAGNNTLILPFTGTLNKDDGRVTIVVGNTNFITNPVIVDSYLINLTSHASADGSGSSVDNVSDEVILRSFDSEGTSSLSDTLSVSLTSYDSRHTLRYNIGTPPAITDGSVKVVLATEFDLSGLVPADISVLGGDVTWGTATVNPSTKTIVIPFTGTLDNTDTLITLLFGNTNFINNPSNTGSYQVRLSTHNSTDGTGSAVEDLTANVAITGGVTVTATVPSSLTFTVLPVASAQSVNGTTTTTTSTASLINFGIIEPSLSKIAAHDLQVSTNSTNGFVVTLQSLSNFTSPGGNTIFNFTGTNATPISWSSPSTTHSFFGYTTADYTLHDVAINRFQSNKWSGPSTTPSEVMYYTDPVEGTGEGLTRVGYQIEIDNLQPAGIYQTNLMYLCTATY